MAPKMTPDEPPDPFGGRVYDLRALLEAERKPIPWRTEPLTADGTLTILSARAGTGKTWVMHELANSVLNGTPAPGFGTAPGRALIFDAEMGEYLTVERFRSQGYSRDITVFNAMGMDLKRDEDRAVIVAAARLFIGEHGGGFVGFDSLRRMCPSAKENDSDDMAGVVAWMAWLMRDVNGAGLLVHHEGWGAKRSRGSSSIVDQADAAWGLHKASEEDEVLKLSCDGDGAKKPRYCAPPEAIFLRIGTAGGLVASEPPKSQLQKHRDAILQAIRDGEHKTRADVARACDAHPKNDSTWGEAWDSLAKKEPIEIRQNDDKVWAAAPAI